LQFEGFQAHSLNYEGRHTHPGRAC
jgi:hypothetical protein